jgi:hypothetical protein
MQPFLHQLANHLNEKYSGSLHRVCVIFPNRRAGLFLRQYLSDIIDKPTWLPQIFALEDFVTNKSSLRIPDQLTLIIRLYEAYLTVEGTKAKKFSEFLSWGTMLLADFDEIDQYLVSGEEVFQYLDELKALQHWNPDGSPLTDFEKDYLNFYRSLSGLYTAFNEMLLSKGEAYFGMAFKQLLDQLEKQDEQDWDTVLFAGFNALTSAEEKLIKHFLSTGKAEVIWDADEYYINDDKQEAGHFLRNLLKDQHLRTNSWIGTHFKSSQKKIEVIGVPGNIGQAKLAGNLISELIASENPSDIALVLVDESLLLPVLNSMPEEIEKFNITMGYPIKLTPAYAFFDSLFRLFLSSVNTDNDTSLNNVKTRYYHKDIERFLSHPYTLYFTTSSTQKNDSIFHLRGKPLLTQEELISLLNQYSPEIGTIFGEMIHKGSMRPFYLIEAFQQTINALKAKVSVPNSGRQNWEHIDNEFLYQYALIIESLRKAVAETELFDSLETLYEVFKTQASALRLPFYGEPLHGLQLMGVLETRTLDFKNIIMLSVNEGLLPKGKHQNTFIPFEVRKVFNLQLYKERNAVFAYHFYRLLQRAENVKLLYNTEGNELGGGERSRFITQILNEMPEYNPGTLLSEKLFAVPPVKTTEWNVSIEKTDEIKSKLYKMAELGFSPTALSRYLNCSLQFCYSYIFNISEKDSVEDTLDAATLGEVIHKALHLTYLPYHNRPISKDELIESVPFAINHLRSVFNEDHKDSDLETGKNLLIRKVAESMLKRFLISEAAFLDNPENRVKDIQVLLLEEDLSSILKIKERSGGKEIPVMIKGKADRIDKVGNLIRIIDYKTGIVKKSEVKIENIEDITELENPSKLLQLLLYAWMFKSSGNFAKSGGESMVSGIISLRQPSHYLINAIIGKEELINSDHLSQFQLTLRSIIEEIFDDSRPFQQTPKIDRCKNCPYKTLCNRL